MAIKNSLWDRKYPRSSVIFRWAWTVHGYPWICLAWAGLEHYYGLLGRAWA
ncbi:hypothetical protein C2G38_2185225 [Gigaspora rosea]|uniref:Uncharacterized protein n=1 Tax=Gigaspora rosea TaxID=44941 RepID=A0A397V6Y2_9GLOM|nr:hypothetical protein C2G38_2185225 [Gigaspora rosea]